MYVQCTCENKALLSIFNISMEQISCKVQTVLKISQVYESPSPLSIMLCMEKWVNVFYDAQ